jgi:hypothetical protein
MRMTATAKVGERLPCLLSALKAPRIAERLAVTAERAREEQWPYEQFLETLCEAEVFAREASGARTRTRTAGFPAHKTLEDFDFTAQPSAERPLVMHLAQLAWIEEHANVCRSAPRAPARVISRSRWGSEPVSTATASRSPPPKNGSAAWKKPRNATPWTKSSNAWSATSC